jgi:hypothetical protein
MNRCLHIAVLTLLAGCSCGQTNQPSAMNNTVAINFPYEMTADQKTNFIETVKTLKAGDSYEAIRRIIGNPLDEAIIQGKKYDDPVRGVMATYYLKKNQRNLVNEKKDEYVLLVFDNDKKLVHIRTNVQGITFPWSTPNPP